eukprot:CAMPEP_0179954228 /NCGR_PEP_ID=MMETSP0983-20121128/25373_1 /TAXON_ID=483367 /ORGANISM="non described non described, Strain CCMP 2436" /LENGTH=117 /DNA_ID=CAMNT_0021865253 /DNA_START=381 /DNA_END=734 /DNA_ORIENTATION=+
MPSSVLRPVQPSWLCTPPRPSSTHPMRSDRLGGSKAEAGSLGPRFFREPLAASSSCSSAAAASVAASSALPRAALFVANWPKMSSMSDAGRLAVTLGGLAAAALLPAAASFALVTAL